MFIGYILYAYFPQDITMTSQWARRRLKSPASPFVYSAVYSRADQRKHQSSASLAFVRGIHRGPVNSPHKWPVTRKIFPFDDVIMKQQSNKYICHMLWYRIPCRPHYWYIWPHIIPCERHLSRGSYFGFVTCVWFLVKSNSIRFLRMECIIIDRKYTNSQSSTEA